MLFIIIFFQWPYNEFVSIVPNFKAQGNNEFIINIKKGKKTDNMRFSSDYRADILTESLRFSNLFCEKFGSIKVTQIMLEIFLHF
jgi:DnaJ family protein C protein 13